MEFIFGLIHAGGCKIHVSWSCSFLLYSMMCMWTSVESWSYSYSQTMMNWADARAWCREHYTDMVAIQNQEEIQHLNNWLPEKKGHYWIGIRKIENVWTWVGTNKTLTTEATNWAALEPNNGNTRNPTGDPEDCVEMYIKRLNDAGKWNDEKCSKQKTALCYSAACKNDSCVHGECVETINNHMCDCLPGFYGDRCEQVVTCRAEELIVPDKANLSCTHKYGEFSYDSSCQYSCEEGYQLSVPTPLRCTATGNWSGPPPACELVKCPELSQPPRGSMQCSDPLGHSSYRSTCVFTCDQGYELNDSLSNTLQCESSGNWNASQPSCIAVQCSAIQSLENGFVSYEDDTDMRFSYGKTCSFSCAHGYRLVGPSKLTCTSSAEWSELMPHCEAITCQNPEGAHLITDCSKLSVLRPSSICRFSCDPGFELQGENTTICSEDGQWSEDIPACRAVQCSAIHSLENGHVKCEDDTGMFSYGNTCSFSCNPGFELQGATSTICSEDGQWSEAIPACRAVQCSAIQSLENGHVKCEDGTGMFSYGNTCSFSCDPGFELQGATSTICSEDGQWSEAIPACRAVQCSAIHNLENGHVKCEDGTGMFSYGNTCSFSCDPGFELQGATSTICSEDGQWSEAIPACRAVQCSAIHSLENGHVKCEDGTGMFSYGNTCSFSCNPGFELQGATSTICSEDGQWSEAIPACRAVQCSAIHNLENGNVKCEDGTGMFSYGNTCSFSCNPGFELQGATSTICSEDGQWSEAIPACRAIQCSALQYLKNGIVKCEDGTGMKFSYGNTCSFSCDPGFELEGANTTTCSVDAQWSEAIPACRAVRCPQLEAPENGIMICTKHEPVFKSQCSFTCDQDYALDGHELLTCDHNGSWSGKKPTCQAVLSNNIITASVAAGSSALGSALLISMWILKRLRKTSKFDLNSNNSDMDFLSNHPQVYKTSNESLV